MRGSKNLRGRLIPNKADSVRAWHFIAAVFLAASGLFSATQATAGELGRLFTTPQERAALERLRNAPPAPPVVQTPIGPIGEPVAKKAEPEKPEAITVNGVVIRSSGNHMVWVNGKNSLTGDLPRKSLAIATDRALGPSVPIRNKRSGKVIELKPGQTFDPGTDKISDRQGDGLVSGEFRFQKP